MEQFASKSKRGWTSSYAPFAAPVIDSPDALAVGIDLGTTNSVIAVWSSENKCVEPFAIDGEEEAILPSFVNVPPGAKSLANCAVGTVEFADGTVVRNAKRLMGRRFDDERVQADVRRGGLMSCEIAAGRDGDAAVRLRGSAALATPAEVSAQVLRRLLAAAAAAGRAVTHAVITVPAHFNVAQRRATRHAAELAGVAVLQLLNEPSAAAMAYGLFVAGSKKVLVVDLGGGTFDVSLLDVADGKVSVAAVGGDSRLGGVDITENLCDVVLAKLGGALDGAGRGGGGGGGGGKDFRRALTAACEDAKVALATRKVVALPCGGAIARALQSAGRAAPASIRVDVDDLAEACAPVLEKCMAIVERVLAESGVDAARVDELVLVGGSSRLRELRTRLSARFDGKELCTSVEPDLAVAQGAAIHAAILSGADQAALQDVLMLDVLPMSIGVVNAADEIDVVLPRNSSLPARATKSFVTAVDGQPGITVDIYEVDDTHVPARGAGPAGRSDRVWMGYFNFGIPKRARGAAGSVSVDVHFEMSGSGVLRVTRAGEGGVEGASGGAEGAEGGEPSLVMPMIYIACLFVLYVVVKLRFHIPGIGPSSEKNDWGAVTLAAAAAAAGESAGAGEERAL